MKKYYLIFSLIFAATILTILFSFRRIYTHQIIYQRNILQEQAQNSGIEIEDNIDRFINEVNKLLFSENLIDIIVNDQLKDEVFFKIELLYSNYKELIENIYIYDQNKNVLNIFYDNKKKTLLIDPYLAQHQQSLAETEKIIKTSKGYQYYLPIFKDSKLTGNIVFTLNIANYINSIASRFHLNNTIWQWITDNNGNVIANNLNKKIDFPSIEIIKKDINSGLSGSHIHKIEVENKNYRILSCYYPLDLFTNRFGLVFSQNLGILKSNLQKMFIISGCCILFLVIALIYLLIIISSKYQIEEKLKNEFSNLKSIIEAAPLGILVTDTNNNVILINSAARELLFFKENEDITGKNLMDRFVLTKNYFEGITDDAAFDSNQFILYKKEGEEIIVYKKEIPHVINNEEVNLNAFIDITSIEKARKYEAASNRAKSEFLAKMSHEIRTPMNGIIGMTEALNQENLSKEQKEYVEIVRKSADLLLNLIDDILDFSKIEAGKMQIEEIPYKLRDEVKIAVDLFRPIIEEKSLNLKIKINQEVPQNVIGDPYRLRQVLSNLISNAVKFTHEGEIVVGVELNEEYDGNLTLLFYVEDTGIGIPSDKIENIFNSFTQADESTSRKYGGSGLGTTISKQLVNLMNGEIWVESPSSISTNPKCPGSKFSFTIEVFSNEKIIKNVKTDHITDFNQLNSLIITRQIDIKSRLNRFLESIQINYQIFNIDDGNDSELLKLLKNENKFQILFILDDPGFDGINLSKKLRDEKYSDNYIIFTISSNHKRENYMLSKKYGTDYYLTEPFEYNDLLKYLHETFVNVSKPSTETIRKIRSDISILVAEDNIINQKVAETIFGNLGFTIDIAQDGNEVIEKVKNHCYDIIFMDLLMPVRDGIQTTVELRGLGYQMPIVAMTATASSKSKSKAIASGMNDYITKPVKTDIVKNILYKWFA
jgi:PAS domain S-box-containing protein